MLKQLLLLLTILLSFQAVYSAEVFVEVELERTQTTFNYLISFSENESYTSFSFEKPRDAVLFYARDSDGNSVRFSSAGDFFIVRPIETMGKTFDLRFTSREVSTIVNEKASYSNYVNFNFPVRRLDYSIDVGSGFSRVVEIFPRNYVIGQDGRVRWNLTQVEQDTLFLLNFEETRANNFFESIYFYILIGLIGIIFIMSIVMAGLIFWRRKDSNKKEKASKDESKEKTVESLAQDKSEPKVQETKQETQTKPIEDQKPAEKPVLETKEETFKEVVNKYLTENEKEIVEVVREHNGITQYDILNFIPTLSKSNLSKIITKLHNKRFLNRIKVGKVNKIHLGERLENKK